MIQTWSNDGINGSNPWISHHRWVQHPTRLDVPRGTNFIAIHLRGATQICISFWPCKFGATWWLCDGFPWCVFSRKHFVCIRTFISMLRWFFLYFLTPCIHFNEETQIWFAFFSEFAQSFLLILDANDFLAYVPAVFPWFVMVRCKRFSRHRGHCLRSKSTCCWWTGGGTWLEFLLETRFRGKMGEG